MVIATAPTGCDADGQPSVLTIRGAADAHVPFDGTAQAVADEARRAGCDSVPRVERPAADAERTRYVGCHNGASITLDAIEGGTHRWPTRQATQPAPAYDATHEVLAFLAIEL